MRKLGVNLLKLLITAGVIAFIINHLGWERIAQTLAHARVAPLVIAVVVFLASIILGVLQWHLLLESKGIALTFYRALVLYFMGMFFNNFIFGSAAGDAVRVAYIKMGDGRGKAGFAATFLDRFAGLWAMLGFAIAGSAILLQKGVIAGRTLTTAILALIVTFALFAAIMAFLVSRRLQRRLLRLLERLPIPGKTFVHALVTQTLLETKDRVLIVPIGLISIVVQLLRIGVHVLCGLSLALVTGANFQYFFIFVPIMAILMIVPLPFGIREAVIGALFVLAGFKADAAMVMEFLASIVGIVASAAGAVFFLTSKARWKPAGQAP